ncbi:ATP-dependent DNA helicase PIF1-like [Bidens hawaiensis]|uniref:ATP-dependent DNA helicase PIF1-like n=1 Tax=Bidens hawaiensis TaxID=980011 RepID=UPI004049A2ED
MDDELEMYIINYLKTMLDANNHLVQAYQMVRDCFKENPQLDLKLRIIGTRQHDARQYNLPSSSEVAALIVGDIGHAIDNRDIIVIMQSGLLKRISELHPSYTPLQYPLFHPFGEDGYQVKLDAMIKLVKDKSLFGKVQAVVYTIEFQKRGLLHAHICIFMHPGSKIHNPQDTAVDSQGFPVYKRRDNGQYVVKSDIMMDNRTVVPYNKTLLKQFQAHINVEWCNQDGSVKYLFKYINKGPDRATISLVQNNNADNPDPNLDEIKAFYDCRYVSTCEATWRIFSFDVHYRTPSVMRLAFHLLGEQQIVYGANEDIEDILNKTTNASSMFAGWFECNKNHDLAKTHIRRVSNKVKRNTDVYELLKKTSLIIWDEAPMIHKHAFEALDRTLNDVMHGDSGNSSEAVFGGKVVVFGGDFRQILPVVTNGTRSECVNACINSSYIWSKCEVLKLTKNMRLTVDCRSSDVENIREFADWLLDIGQGNVGGPNDGQSVIDIPDDLLILNSVDPMGDLITFVYSNILDRFNELTYFQNRALLAPLNEVVQEINECMLAIFPGEEVEYLSSDSLAEFEDVSEDFDPHLYSPDLLNGLKMSGMPNHRLVLKVGVPIMLLRNINHKKGLCNGTRLQVVSLGRRVIDAKVISGTNIGYRILISRVTLTPTDKKLPFRLKRRQFPISLCFSMTIHKSQGQSLSRVGLYLKDLVFSHGQLYVALSRVKSRDGIKLVILDKESKLTNKTTNVVYKEIFGNVE